MLQSLPWSLHHPPLKSKDVYRIPHRQSAGFGPDSASHELLIPGLCLEKWLSGARVTRSAATPRYQEDAV